MWESFTTKLFIWTSYSLFVLKCSKYFMISGVWSRGLFFCFFRCCRLSVRVLDVKKSIASFFTDKFLALSSNKQLSVRKKIRGALKFFLSPSVQIFEPCDKVGNQLLHYFDKINFIIFVSFTLPLNFMFIN